MRLSVKRVREERLKASSSAAWRKQAQEGGQFGACDGVGFLEASGCNKELFFLRGAVEPCANGYGPTTVVCVAGSIRVEGRECGPGERQCGEVGFWVFCDGRHRRKEEWWVTCKGRRGSGCE